MTVKLDYTLEKIKNALENVGKKYEITEEGLLVRGKMSGVKTKASKGLKETIGYKIVKANGGYFGAYEFKSVMSGGTTGGFDMKELTKDGQNYTLIYARGGVGYMGID